MGKPPKPNNIVEKIFFRNDASRKVSSLFNPSGIAGRSFIFRGRKSQSAIRRLNPVFDFGTSSVKLLQLLLMPNGDFEVSALDEQPYASRESSDPLKAHREALEELLERNKIDGPCIVGIPVSEIQFYHFTFPVLADKELEEAIYWKLRPLKPFDLELERVRFNYTKWEDHLAGQGTAVQQRVVVVCARMDYLQSKVELFRKRGIKIQLIEASPLSLIHHRRFRSAATEPETLLWLDMGAEETTIVVDRDGTLCHVKKLGITSRKLTQQLAQYCRVDEARAEELKKIHGLSFWSMDKKIAMLNASRIETKEDEASAVFYGLISALENLVVDIEHSFKNFAYQVSQSQALKFDRVILTGGGAQLTNLELFLRVRLGVPIEKLDPLQNLKVPERIKILRKTELDRPLSFASVIGLSFGSLRAQAKKMNLLPPPAKYPAQILWAKISKEPKWMIMAAGLLLALLVLPQYGAMQYYKQKAEESEKKLRVSRTELTQLQSTQVDLAEQETKLTEKKSFLENKLQILSQSKSSIKPFSEVLASLGIMLHEEIWISKLNYADKKLSITGMTMENELISGFIEALKSSEGFQDVTFNYTQKEPNSPVYRFEVVMSVK